MRVWKQSVELLYSIYRCFPKKGVDYEKNLFTFGINKLIFYQKDFIVQAYKICEGYSENQEDRKRSCLKQLS